MKKQCPKILLISNCSTNIFWQSFFLCHILIYIQTAPECIYVLSLQPFFRLCEEDCLVQRRLLALHLTLHGDKFEIVKPISLRLIFQFLELQKKFTAFHFCHNTWNVVILFNFVRDIARDKSYWFFHFSKTNSCPVTLSFQHDF